MFEWFNEIKWEHLYDPKLAWESLPFLFEGLKYTLYIALFSMFFALILGVLIGIARMSKFLFLRWPARIYISFMRGTPLLVFLFILYYGFPVLGINFSSPIIAGIIGISMNFAAYNAEVVRSAIMSVPRGQWEAAASLQMGYVQTLRRIIIPQATRIALPPTFSIFMDVVKGTSLASVITVQELLYSARLVSGRTFESMTMYTTAALIYWVVCIVIGYFQERLEKRYNRYLSKR
ncbi:cysteine ABC transporter permease [Anaerobacillus alkalidiazotrophicus]|uniref:Cysteine ABC transporter permease n=1 Tax=Anaerobacillus alkalidiazotrophicus TaxID=472963 RepID=A0A1S2MD15_9BACI|nr:amino acid ABC transporter permease [Anaerobacillus alkalidiazotrophicus]OIJ22454.1 cysteine ABC transporter permease [Anaerobacillus alkalidiazotrophicus]